MKPIAYDARRLESLIGKPTLTPSDIDIAHTLDALAAAKA